MRTLQGEGNEEKPIQIQGEYCQRVALIVPFLVILENGEKIPIKALVDTGCENNIIKKGLIPHRYFATARKQIRFVTANGTILGGGDMEAHLRLLTCADLVGGESIRLLELPTTFYEADIKVDALLSFGLLQDFHLKLKARKCGLKTHTNPQ